MPSCSMQAQSPTLRRYLGLIYQRLLKSGKANMRLGVVVSSRHDDGWRGLSPDPRLSVLSLTEFKVGIVQRGAARTGGVGPSLQRG